MPGPRAALRPAGRRARPATDRIDEQAVIEAVGVNCARLRRERGLSLSTLARQSGLSKGMLIEIEQRRTNPSIATLCRIAQALQVGLAQILYGEPAAARIAPHSTASGREFWRTAAGSSAVLVDAARVLHVGGELWRWVLAPGESFAGAAHPQGTQEFLYVSRGTLAVSVGDETARCAARESLRIGADVPHTYRNPGRVTCEFVMCVMEPMAGQSRRRGPLRTTPRVPVARRARPIE